MTEISYIERSTGKHHTEKVYGHWVLTLLYGPKWWHAVIRVLVLPFIARCSFLSFLYGAIQKTRWSRRKIVPFIHSFGVDQTEFRDPVSSFKSFNDFFIRHLKKESRPLPENPDCAILPADARYRFFPQLDEATEFYAKGQRFCVSSLLQDSALAQKYVKGSMVIARLCPVDYHRFHFPCSGTPLWERSLPGPLFSVNPLALRRKIGILSENKRVITALDTPRFGTVLYVEIGATYVGTIHQTYRMGKPCSRGEEKGYFSFGGSCIILLFEPGRILFADDLLDYAKQPLEIRGFLGQPLGLPFA